MAIVYRIVPDEDPLNPRKDWTPFGVMVCAHNRYTLGDREPTEQEFNALARGGFPLLERYLRRYEGATVVLPLALLDHSGLHMWIGSGPHWSDSAGWDSGLVGFIYDSAESREVTGVEPENAEAQLTIEVETYDQYLRGDVYGYEVYEVGDTDDDGDPVEDGSEVEDEPDDSELLDSCWGFFGRDYCEQEAKEQVAYCQKQRAEADEEEVPV